MSNGYNPMRWDCQKRGCFNQKRRPKIEIFHDLFPGKINFGDVDGIVEINAKALLLEWKCDDIDLPRGQQIMYRRLTKNGDLTVIVLCGSAETMDVQYMGYFFEGQYSPAERASIEQAREWISSWVDYAYGRA